eukprot:1148027-Pelagomonas_calceolata.AAC.2
MLDRFFVMHISPDFSFHTSSYCCPEACATPDPTPLHAEIERQGEAEVFQEDKEGAAGDEVSHG